MKTSKKQKRKLHHKGTDFLYIVSKNDDGVMLRIYTKQFKSTVCTFSISWRIAHDVNLNLPRVVKGVLETSIESGWTYEEPNKQLRLEVSEGLIRKLTVLSEDYEK